MFYTPTPIEQMKLRSEREEFFASHVPSHFNFDTNGTMFYTDLPAVGRPEHALPLENALESLYRLTQEAIALSHQVSMYAMNPNAGEHNYLLWQQAYEQWQSKIDAASSAVEWVRDAVTPQIILFPHDKTDFVWIAHPAGYTVPLNTRYWRKIYVSKPDETGTVYCYEAHLMGGFPPGTKIYHHDKVFHI